MVGTLIERETSPDAELVAQSRRGDREAFGRIVRRYQAMVAGVVYSFCGDFHRSEDLAQETFIAAWKSLSGMNDPAKLSPWLCQIARRKAMDFQRSNVREKNRLTQLFHVPAANPPASPSEEILADEERALLWSVLSKLPQPYRETMILYYRQGQSTSAVALAMDTTEDSVRQRLARGRTMLREQVAKSLERQLTSSSPGPAFAVAIMAALPALVPHTVKAATLGAATKGSASVAGGGVLALISSMSGPLLAVTMAVRGTWQAVQSARSARERRFIIGYAILAAVCLNGICFFYFRDSFAWPARFNFQPSDLAKIGMMLGSTLVAAVLIRLGRWRWNVIRLAETPDPKFVAAAQRPPNHKPIWVILCIVFSSMIWMFNLAFQTRDFKSLVVLSGVAAVLSALSVYCWRHRNPVIVRRFTFLFAPMLGAITLCLAKWRLAEWIMVANHHAHLHPIQWRGLVPMAMFFICFEIFMLALLVRSKQEISK
jgi:RNA polymerase sigma factor (sigma-70 family)